MFNRTKKKPNIYKHIKSQYISQALLVGSAVEGAGVGSRVVGGSVGKADVGEGVGADEVGAGVGAAAGTVAEELLAESVL